MDPEDYSEESSVQMDQAEEDLEFEEGNDEDFMEYDELEYEERGPEVNLEEEVRKLEQENSKADKQKQKQILVDKEYFEKLLSNLKRSKGYGTCKKLIGLFSECSGDNDNLDFTKRRVYIINDLDVLDRISTFMLSEFPTYLENKAEFKYFFVKKELKKEKLFWVTKNYKI